MVQDEHLRASNDKRSWTGSLITLSNLGIFPTDVSRPPEPSGVVHVDDLPSLSAKAMMRPTPHGIRDRYSAPKVRLLPPYTQCVFREHKA